MDERKIMATMLSIATIAAQSAVAMEIQENKLDILMFQKERWSMAEEIFYRQLTGTTDVIKEMVTNAETELEELKKQVQNKKESSVFKDEVRAMSDFIESMEPALVTLKNYNNRLTNAMNDTKNNIIKKMGN